MRIFFLGHAGGAASAYPPLFPALGAKAALLALDLPGHGRRAAEPLLYGIPEMVDNLEAEFFRLGGAAEGGFVLFGHSLGGLLAFLLALRLEGQGLAARHVFISSSAVPGQHYVPERFMDLPDMELWEQSADYFGGISPEARSSPELTAFFAPLLRADLQAVTSYRPGPAEWLTWALDAPLTVLGGAEDIVDEADAANWRRHAAGRFNRRVLPGGHFHVQQNPAQCERVLLEGLKPELA